MSMFNVTTNAGGIPYISSTNVTVGTESVDIALGFRRIQPVGYFTVRMGVGIPSDATGTLPVTAADLESVNVFTVFNDRFNGVLTLMSRTTV